MQGQTIQTVGIWLPDPVFCHGQLNTGATRATHPDRIKFAIRPNQDGRLLTTNVVYKEVLPNQSIQNPPPLPSRQLHDDTLMETVNLPIEIPAVSTGDLDYTGPYDAVHSEDDQDLEE